MRQYCPISSMLLAYAQCSRFLLEDTEMTKYSLCKNLPTIKATLSLSFDHLEHGPQNARYTSKTIQNEVIAVMANLIHDYFCQCLEKCPHFSLIADETTSDGREILSVCLRFLDFVEDPCRPIKREVLIDLCDLTRTTGKAIATALTER
ncbi:unnamed protein product [Porites evermanni]|uniref:DUF4371 domain-containing protein n=1 Tax=Porites evermanni TaxID=104178 RepID=A0ABN8QFC3_9CNID|nr:unnamed protein product [Porites evermanni]